MAKRPKRQREDRELTRAREAVFGPPPRRANQAELTMAYEEWKARRLERVPGRCGGRPTFIRSRIQPCDASRLSLDWQNDIRVAAEWGVNAQDIVYSKRFCAEEPHWENLSSGYDRSRPRQLTDSELAALHAKAKIS